MAKKADKKKAVAKRIAAKRLRTRQKRDRTRRQGFEAKLEKVLGNIDQDEAQRYLMGSASLLSEPELDWVRFTPDEASRLTRTYYESHQAELEPAAADAAEDADTEGSDAEATDAEPEAAPEEPAAAREEEDEEEEEEEDRETARHEALERLYSDAISKLATKPMLFRLKSSLHSLAKRSREEGDRERMMQAVCAEAMFRADVHVSAHPILIVAFERARDAGLAEDELPAVRGYSLLDQRRGAQGESGAGEEPESTAAEAAAAGASDEAAAAPQS